MKRDAHISPIYFFISLIKQAACLELQRAGRGWLNLPLQRC